MTEKLFPYDPAEDILDENAMAEFMANAFETQDAGYIAHAMGVVARAKGMAQIARETGLSRESLYRTFSEDGNPILKTLLAIMKSLNIGLSAKLHTAKSATRKRNIAPKTTRKTERKTPASQLPDSLTWW